MNPNLVRRGLESDKGVVTGMLWWWRVSQLRKLALTVLHQTVQNITVVSCINSLTTKDEFTVQNQANTKGNHHHALSCAPNLTRLLLEDCVLSDLGVVAVNAILVASNDSWWEIWVIPGLMMNILKDSDMVLLLLGSQKIAKAPNQRSQKYM